MSDEQRQALDLVRVSAIQLQHARAKADQLLRQIEDEMRAAVSLGCSAQDVADMAGVSRARVQKVAPASKYRKQGAQTRVHAQKNTVTPVCVADADTVPILLNKHAEPLSGVQSVRNRSTRYGRPTWFWSSTGGAVYEVHNGHVACVANGVPSIEHVLDGARKLGVRSVRVFITGPAPMGEGATKAEATRAWALGVAADGWEVDGGHYLADADLPQLRFKHTDGTKAVVMRAAAWWGESGADAATCAGAWNGLGVMLEKVPAFAGAGLADTPATAGRALWLRTVPESHGWAVQSDEVRQLIHATSGQGRSELLAPAKRDVERFTYMDGRFMYAGLTWGMPVGEPTFWAPAPIRQATDDVLERMLRGRGRWRITATVPKDWAHVGLLMAPRAEGGWCYPGKHEAGMSFTTWADGSEVYMARKHGWSVQLHEGMTWAEGKPLDTWTKALLSVWEECRANGSESAQLAARAIRSMLLFSIGAFAQTAHNVSGSTPIDTPEAVPADVIPGSVHMVGDRLVWERPGKLSTFSEQLSHPEWSATIWARARMRLLEGPGGAGALTLPYESIVAFATDALYLDGAPDWADDGKVGRFRVKGQISEPRPWPLDRVGLYQLRDEAEL